LKSQTLKFESPGRLAIAGAPEGRAALALAEIAFGAAGRPVVHIARDDAGMARTADMLSFFAPALDVAIDEALLDFIKQRKNSMADAFT